MKKNETKTTYLAPQVKVVKVAVERGFAGTSTPNPAFLWLVASDYNASSQSLEARGDGGSWTDGSGRW